MKNFFFVSPFKCGSTENNCILTVAFALHSYNILCYLGPENTIIYTCERMTTKGKFHLIIVMETLDTCMNPRTPLWI